MYIKIINNYSLFASYSISQSDILEFLSINLSKKCVSHRGHVKYQ